MATMNKAQSSGKAAIKHSEANATRRRRAARVRKDRKTATWRR